MRRTLYKVKNPESIENTGEPESLHDAEYRQVILENAQHGGFANGCMVIVKQGWFDSQKPGGIHSRQLSSQHFDTWEAAEAEYKIQLNHLVETGFAHSFSLNPFGPEPIYEELGT